MPSEAKSNEDSPKKQRILEIGFQRLLGSAFPEQVQFVDTRFRWENPRTQKSRNGVGRSAIGLAHAFLRAWRLSNESWDAVVTRCLGPVNSQGKSLMVHGGLVILGQALAGLVRRAARGRHTRLAVIDQTDHLTIHARDRGLARRCDLYFKRELAENLWSSLEGILPRGANLGAARAALRMQKLRAKLRPFALGIDESEILEPIPSAAKKYDLFYCGTPDQLPLRERIPALLAAVKANGWRILAPDQRIPLSEFRESIRASRFCLSPGGVGWDCYRHYEVAACGSIPLMNFRTVVAIDPFEHGHECFYFDPQADFLQQVESWLNLPANQTDVLARAAQKKLRDHYTFKALAHYVMAEIRSLT
jgi:hypothetical protein